MTDINVKDTDCLYNTAYVMGECKEGKLDDLSMGSLDSCQNWETNWDEPEDTRPHLEEKMYWIHRELDEEEEISEEHAEKIERLTRNREEEETASEIAAKAHGELLRFEARKRIEENPQAYEGLPRYKDSDDDEEDVSEEVPYFDWEAEDAVERWNAQMEKEREIIVKERDIYLANGGLTNEEFTYLCRHIDAHF